jgi:hypothetical protein
MKRDRTVASESTIDGGGAISISPSRVQETGCGTEGITGGGTYKGGLTAAGPAYEFEGQYTLKR